MVAKNRVRWLGHAAFEIVTAEGVRILIDPWITGNPSCPAEKEEFSDVDIILVSHDHFDHVGEDMPYLLRAEPTVAVQPEVLADLKNKGLQEGIGMNVGGTVEVGDIQITMVQAFHSSGSGSPCGYILTTEDERKIYHAGDTGVFATMQLFGNMYDIDVALLPIGSVYVMDPLQAAHAAKMLRADTAVPMHYGTFPALVQDADEFSERVSELAPDTQVCVLRPGGEMSL